jgi:hypothetical protein
MSDLHEAAHDLGKVDPDARVKMILAAGPMQECTTCFPGIVTFASADGGAHLVAAHIERLAAARIVQIEGAPGARVARLTS